MLYLKQFNIKSAAFKIKALEKDPKITYRYPSFFKGRNHICTLIIHNREIRAFVWHRRI